MASLRIFKYTIKDKEFCPGDNEIVVDTNQVVILGERDDWRVWDDYKKAYIVTRAFMINYKGTEYGSETTIPQDLSCNPCSSGSPFQIFEPQFENQFE